MTKANRRKAHRVEAERGTQVERIRAKFDDGVIIAAQLLSARNKCASLDPAATARQRGQGVQIPVPATNDMCDDAGNKYYLLRMYAIKLVFNQVGPTLSHSF